MVVAVLLMSVTVVLIFKWIIRSFERKQSGLWVGRDEVAGEVTFDSSVCN